MLQMMMFVCVQWWRRPCLQAFDRVASVTSASTVFTVHRQHHLQTATTSSYLVKLTGGQVCSQASRLKSLVSAPSRVHGWSSLRQASASTSLWWISPRTTARRPSSSPPPQPAAGHDVTCHRRVGRVSRNDSTTRERAIAASMQSSAKTLALRTWSSVLTIDLALVSSTRPSLTDSKWSSVTWRRRRLTMTTTINSTSPLNTKVVQQCVLRCNVFNPTHLTASVQWWYRYRYSRV